MLEIQFFYANINLNNLLLASITILLRFFFLFFVIFNNYFIILVFKENIKLKCALAIPTGAPIIFAKELIDIHLLVADKTIKFLSKQSKAAMYLFSFLHIFSLSLISAVFNFQCC